MKLICISGPRGSGKEALKNRLLGSFNLRRIVPHTTRKRRDCEEHGREHYYIGPEDFAELNRTRAFVFQATTKGHRYGTTRGELFKDNTDCVVEITANGARTLKAEVELNGDQVLLVFIHASREERRGRIRLRQPDLTEEGVEELLANEPSPEGISLYPDFDLTVENPDGQFERAAVFVEKVVLQFLR